DVLQLTLMMDAVWKVVDHKRSEEKLKKSEEKYRRLAENISDVVWIADLDANLTFITPSVQKLLDETVEENIKKSFNERFTPDSLKKILPMFQEEFEKEQIPGIDKNRSRIIEAEQYKKDGSTVNVSMHISFIRDDEGKPIGFLGVTRDITAQKKAEEEKSKLQIRLMQAQKMESIGRLAGGVAHDFNNMLTVIIGRAELALMKTDPSNPVYKELNEIKNAAERSATLTAQLLAFARKQVIVPKTIQLNDTIVKMFGMLEKLVGENIELQLLPGKNLWDIKIDTTQIDQIIANLCVNSKDAMEDHGRIVIRTENLIINNPDMEKTPGLNKGEYVCLSVSDNGCGMDEETKRHIFEPFFTTKENGEGTGLGLATIYGVVKQNKGYIYIESNPENGSEFTIYFPRQI
ncbi:MAG TPA: ATP-binding protein, partial [bacterium]|nr:ATP-binding protein [bacterium]